MFTVYLNTFPQVWVIIIDTNFFFIFTPEDNFVPFIFFTWMEEREGFVVILLSFSCIWRFRFLLLSPQVSSVKTLTGRLPGRLSLWPCGVPFSVASGGRTPVTSRLTHTILGVLPTPNARGSRRSSPPTLAPIIVFQVTFSQIPNHRGCDRLMITDLASVSGSPWSVHLPLISCDRRE